MTRYEKTFKDRAVTRLLPPENAPVDAVSQELHISAATLERWRAAALAAPDKERIWTPAARMQAIIATAAMDEASRSAWCREKGIYPQELELWRETATHSLESPEEASQEGAACHPGHPTPRQGAGEGSEAQGEGAGRDHCAAGSLKKVGRDLPSGRGRGHMTSLEDRRIIVRHIDEAHAAGARFVSACKVAGITARTLQRWRAEGGQILPDGRRTASRPQPAHALTETTPTMLCSCSIAWRSRRKAIHAKPQRPVLHGDNGSTLKATMVLAILNRLGIRPFCSQPRVDDDNVFVEALFKTAKYRPEFPVDGVAGLDEVRQWGHRFVAWYNDEHRHSRIGYVTPSKRHDGQDVDILQAQHRLYQTARSQTPSRWSGNTRNWQPITRVTLNPERDSLAQAATNPCNNGQVAA